MNQPPKVYASRNVYLRVCCGAIEPDTFEQHAISDHEAASHLHGRGLAVSMDMLNNLKRRKDDVVPKSDKPSRYPSWTPELIEKVAEHYAAMSPPRLTALAGFLHQQGLTMDDYLLALESANKAAIKEFESSAFGTLWHRNTFTPDASNFELHILPARGRKKAKIHFTLRDDVRNEMERKSKARK